MTHIFNDADAVQTLSYTIDTGIATFLSVSNSAEIYTFAGTPTNNNQGTHLIKINATDSFYCWGKLINTS